ncbi:Hypp7852 [Branchiostoma lanceolatum]|uniref:Hypp7852 protein n=1 Tax=Branchiostoma lanceolatum TaxID=7740 RepID=A0A8J9Z4K8_BRALA|nr:Hypp7852 [Branchiostoma lanceolatum]
MRILCCCFGGEAEGEGRGAANENTSLFRRKVVEPPLSRGTTGSDAHVTSVRFSKRVRKQEAAEYPSHGHKVQVFRVQVPHLDEMYSDAARLLTELQEEHQKLVEGLKRFKALFGCDEAKSLSACLVEINNRKSGTTFHLMFSSAHSFSLCPEGDVSTPEVRQAVAEVASLNQALKEIISRSPRLQLSLQRIVGEKESDRERVEGEHGNWADRQRALLNFDKNLGVFETGLSRVGEVSSQAEEVLKDVKVAVDG